MTYTVRHRYNRFDTLQKQLGKTTTQAKFINMRQNNLHFQNQSAMIGRQIFLWEYTSLLRDFSCCQSNGWMRELKSQDAIKLNSTLNQMRVARDS